MKIKNYKNTKLIDATGMAVSIICFVHCLVMPLLYVMLPVLSVVSMFDHGTTHILLLGMAFPLALWSIYVGCRGYGHKLCSIFAVFALMLMTLALFFHEWETILTLAGATTLMLIHFYHMYAKSKLTSSKSDTDTCDHNKLTSDPQSLGEA